MFSYNLFVIKKENYALYHRNAPILYDILKNLYRLDKQNYVYGISVYHQLCNPINVKLLQNYMIEKIPSTKEGRTCFHILSFFETTDVILKPSRIQIQTSVANPAILKVLNIYNREIFICDFQKNIYFWLDERLKETNPK